MPGARHSATLAPIACAIGDPTSAGGDGKGAANGNAGTEGDWASCTDMGGCAQCHAHSGGACFACNIDIPWQGTVIATLPADASGIAQRWQANTNGWNNSDNTNSSVSRRRVRREGRRADFTVPLYSKPVPVRIDPHQTMDQSLTDRKRSALLITDTEDRLIAAAAMTGLSSRPNTGYSTPAATGIPSAL